MPLVSAIAMHLGWRYDTVGPKGMAEIHGLHIRERCRSSRDVQVRLCQAGGRDSKNRPADVAGVRRNLGRNWPMGAKARIAARYV